METNYPPIIIIGMHRSGTSMLSRMLEQQGLFLGKTKGKPENNESKFFRTLNNWLFQQAGAHWDDPAAWHLWLANEQAREASVNFVRGLLGTPRAISYLGLRDYLRYRSPSAWPRPWGWKDPLNTYTLPIWLQLYPQARVIHIYRNGVDVAGSLRRRSLRQLQEFDAWSARVRRRIALQARPLPSKVLSLRCLTLEGSFALWQTYMEEAARQSAALPPAQLITVRYEDVLSDPAAQAAALCEFAGLPLDQAALDRWVGGLNTSRASAFTMDPELQAFYESVRHSPQMRAYGYDA